MDIYQDDTQKDVKQFTFKFSLQSGKKTITQKDADNIFNDIVAKVEAIGGKLKA
jgi:phenylalanyl-tRNA synthetase beta subunit